MTDADRERIIAEQHAEAEGRRRLAEQSELVEIRVGGPGGPVIHTSKAQAEAIREAERQQKIADAEMILAELKKADSVEVCSGQAHIRGGMTRAFSRLTAASSGVPLQLLVAVALGGRYSTVSAVIRQCWEFPPGTVNGGHSHLLTGACRAVSYT